MPEATRTAEPEVIRVGQQVPDFKMDAFDPIKKDFSSVSLEGLKKEKKWTVLFFYPADYTFVCPTELADLANFHDRMKKDGVEVFAENFIKAVNVKTRRTLGADHKLEHRDVIEIMHKG